MGRKPQKTAAARRRLWCMLLIAASVLLMGGAVVHAGNHAALTENATQTEPAAERPPVSNLGTDDQPSRLSNSKTINLLLIGRDAAGSSGSRSDAMILCTFNRKNDTITITSFLRDLYVKIPGHKSNRINAAYRFGGTKLLNETLQKNFGIEVDGNIEVDFKCFEQIIDKLGGVTIELTAAEAKFINKHVRGSNLTKGTQLLTGAQALAYSRNRYDSDGDFSRTNRQRKLLSVLLETYKRKTLPEMLALVQDLLPMISTDISKSDLTGYAISLIPMLSGAAIRMQAIPVEGGYRYAKIDGKSVLLPDLAKNRQVLEDALK